MLTAFDAYRSLPQGENKQIQHIHGTSEVAAHKSNFLWGLPHHRNPGQQNDKHSTTQKVYVSARIRVSSEDR